MIGGCEDRCPECHGLGFITVHRSINGVRSQSSRSSKCPRCDGMSAIMNLGNGGQYEDTESGSEESS